MITVISSTNRPGSKSYIVAHIYKDILVSLGKEAQVLSLTDLPRDFAFDLFGEHSHAMEAIIADYVGKADKFVFVIPEYQGSFPGVLKAFLDGIHPRLFREKKAAIIGLSDGRAGNLRGQEHLTGILHYLKVHVHYSKPKLSVIDSLLDSDNKFIDERTIRLLNEHAVVIADY